jgi:hypothetical protein
MLVRVFIHPSVSEGSLGTGVPRDDKKGSVSQDDKKGSVLRDDRDGLSPRAPLLCHPEASAEGSSPEASPRTK